jgi:hypothetical protein
VWLGTSGQLFSKRPGRDSSASGESAGAVLAGAARVPTRTRHAARRGLDAASDSAYYAMPRRKTCVVSCAVSLMWGEGA